MDKAENIDKYISRFPADVQLRLQEIREAISKVAPGATQDIRYAIPTFILGKNLIHFAAYKNHIGVYPVPKGDEKWRNKVAKYQAGKGTMQFPLSEPTPLKVITEAVKWRMKEV